MSEKPILFNTSMVQAILEGEKTVTRRVVKSKSKNAAGFTINYDNNNSFIDVYDHDGDERMFDNPQPRYRVGDILYVRETWFRDEESYFYKTDIDMDEAIEEMKEKGLKWKPSIHMPKAAARIFLKVTNVRVERLQDITDEECYKEGISGTKFYDEVEHLQIAGIGLNDSLERLAFGLLWNSTLDKTDLYRVAWDNNPWVWVIEFERIDR